MVKAGRSIMTAALMSVLILVVGTTLPALTSMFYSVNIGSSDAYAQKENSQSKSQDENDAKEAMLNALYTNDPEFRASVDMIRDIVRNYDTIDDALWEEAKDALNTIFVKIGEQPMTLDQETQFRAQLEEDAKNINMLEYEQQSSTNETPASQSSLMAISCVSTIANTYLPAIYQPTSDINNGNNIIRTYAKVFDEAIYTFSVPGKCIIEVTHVYDDEDHPTLDAWYDGFRWTVWGRVEDIETYFIVVDKTSGVITRLSFQGLNLIESSTNNLIDPIYSSTNTWNNEAHASAKITSFSYYTANHPKIYVNTWNHALGQNDNNSGMSKTIVTTYSSVWVGNRMNAENTYQSLHSYTSEDLQAGP